jgi:hypothetical protein
VVPSSAGIDIRVGKEGLMNNGRRNSEIRQGGK